MKRACRIALLALEGLRRTPLRVTLTALGVAIASGAMVSMVAFALGIQEQAETPFKTLGLFNVVEVKPEKGEDDEEKPILDDDALRRIEALPGVEMVFPEIRLKGIKLVRGEKNKTVMAMGLPRRTPLAGATDEILIAGEYFSPGDKAQVILSRRLTRDLGFDAPEDAVDAELIIEASGLSPQEASTFQYEQKNVPVKVAGVYEVGRVMPGPMARTVLLPIDLMKQIPGVRFKPAMDFLKAGKEATQAGYSGATVRVRRHDDLKPVEEAIKEMGFKTKTLLSQIEEMRAFFVFVDVLLASIGAIALVVAALGIINTLLMAVLERYQEIGIYKAIGASDGDLVVLFLTEAGVIGLLGGAGGVALGWGVSGILEALVNAYARSEGVTAYLDVFAFPTWLLAATILFAALISVLSGVYPALRAARIDPIRALRRE